MRTIWQDIRYGLRILARSPGYAIIMVVTLALGIGATTAIFSMVNGVLLQPLAYPQSQQLIFVGESISAFADRFPVLPVPPGQFLEWRQRCSSFESLSLFVKGDKTMTGRGQPERLEALEVSANLFEILRVPSALGRLFAPEDEEAASHVAVISDGLWRRKFDADPSVLGQTITLDDDAYTIVGVLPESFRFPNVNLFDTELFKSSARPAIFVPKAFTSRERNELMSNFSFCVIGRLKAGITRQRATAELNVIAAQIAETAGKKDWKLRTVVEPLKEVLVQNSRRGLLVLLGAIGTLLLIACLNLGILGLVRAEHRGLESAVRAALGASRTQLLRQALMETILMALPGAVLGVALASVGIDILMRIVPADIPRLSEVRIDGNVLFFALVLTGITAALSGVLPACRTAGTNIERVLKAGGRTATSDALALRLRSGLVVAEVGLGVMLLVTAGLLLDSFARVMYADRGFQAPTVLAADVVVPPAKQKQAVGFHDRLLERLASAPGIDSAAIVNALPLEGEQWVNPVWVPGGTRPESERPMANMRIISPAYFQIMGIPLLEGRTFDQTDRSGADNNQPRPVVVISERLAQALWPGQDTVVGRKVILSDGPQCEVIGVVKDVRARADHEAAPILYRPYWLLDVPDVTIVARTRGNPLSIAGSIRSAVHKVDAEVPITNLRTMREVLDESVSQRRFQMLLTCTFASCALLLAGLGVYGVVSYSVARRTREMGIRAAFGAGSFDLCSIVLRQGMRPVALGLIFGVAGAWACGRILQSLLYQTKAHDPVVISLVIAVMLVTGVLACYVPARRAAKVDPMEALRYE
jgi:putative ABC transport system permease protein